MENINVYKDSKIYYDRYPILIKCTIKIRNMTDKIIENLKYIENMNYDGTGIGIGDIQIDDPCFNFVNTKGKLSIEGGILKVNPFEEIQIGYSFLVESVLRGGVYTLASLIRLRSCNESKMISDNIFCNVAEVRTDLKCFTRCYGKGGFRVKVIVNKDTCECKIRVKAKMYIEETVTLKFLEIKGFHAIDGTTGAPIKLNESITNTTVEFFRTIKVQRCTNNLFTVVIQVVDITGIDENKIIPFYLLEPSLKEGENCMFLNIPKLKEERIIVNSKLKCCNECVQKGI